MCLKTLIKGGCNYTIQCTNSSNESGIMVNVYSIKSDVNQSLTSTDALSVMQQIAINEYY